MTNRKGGEKPSKPRPDYPLTPHARGQWCKKIHGKLFYFGTWEDPVAAEEEYNQRLPEILGQTSESDSLTLRKLCNRFLNSKHVLVKSGELKQRTFDEYKAACDRLTSHFGPARPVRSLRAVDFEKLRLSLPDSWGLVTINNFIVRSKAVFNFAYAEELIDAPVRTGSSFKRASQKRMRIVKAQSEAKFFTAREIHALHDAAAVKMKAMILCGINLGFGNLDCSNLRRSSLDLKDGWFTDRREKTGIIRAGKLWPETIKALSAVLESRASGQEHAAEDRVFLTAKGNPYCRPGKDDALSKEFAKLRKKCSIYRKGVGFYSLRHCTQTIGEGSGDMTAVRVLMGHVDSSISETYRAHFDRDRVKSVSEHIRQWFLEGSSK